MRRIGLGAALVLASARPVAASDTANCYAAGNAELAREAPRFDLAGAAFESAAALDACTAAAARLYVSAGYAYRQHAEGSGDPIWYCKAAAAWRAALRGARSQRMVDRLRGNLRADEGACASPDAPATPDAGPPPAPDAGTPPPRAPDASAPVTAPESAAGDEGDDTALWLIVGGAAAVAVAAGVTIWLLAGDAEPDPVNSIELRLNSSD